MLRRCLTPAVAIALVLAACSPETAPTTAPADAPIGIQGAPVVVPANPYCTLKTIAAIEAEINALFATPGWPNASSAKAKLKNVTKALTKGDLPGAIKHARDLVGFIKLKFGQLSPTQQAAVEAQVDQLIADVLCQVGLSGEVFDLNPTTGPVAFAVPGEEEQNAGVFFPAGSYVPPGAVVTLTVIPPTENPLITPLDKYPTYLDVATFPEFTLPPGVVVGVCLPSTTPPGAAARARLGHQLGTVFELLALQEIPPALALALNCSGEFAQEPTSAVGKVLARLADLFLPRKVQASMYALGGVGGSPEEFSPFGAVDPGLTARGAGGVGGSPEEFAPPPQFGPMAGPAATPPVPLGTISGTVGSTTSGVPVVEVLTMGLGTPIPGVTVTFSVQPADSIPGFGEAPGNAALCGESSTVEVVTGVDGRAALPCLNFGTIPGYSNVKAEFDPSSLNFPGADLVFVGKQGDTAPTPGYSVNFLVEATGLVPWQASGYRYLLTSLGGESETPFYQATFNASSWLTGAAPFGGGPFPYDGCTLYNTTAPPVTPWPLNSDVLVRKTFVLAEAAWVQVRIAIDNDVQVWLNETDYTGLLGATLNEDGLAVHEGCAERPASGAAFTFTTQAQAGANLLAIRARDRGAIGYFDVMVEIVPEPED